MNEPEGMSEFFTARTEGYDEHMLDEVEGCREGYKEMARLVPPDTERLLDLGCGTGLELDEIFKLLPGVCVTGIDITEAMLAKLRNKHPDKDMRLICANYFEEEFGENCFDCAVSFQTMHHFTQDMKAGLYKKLLRSLRSGGIYIECDYMVEEQREEDFYFSECARLRRENNIPDSKFIHYDTPCTVENQIKLLNKAGFGKVEKVMRIGNTTILVARI